MLQPFQIIFISRQIIIKPYKKTVSKSIFLVTPIAWREYLQHEIVRTNIHVWVGAASNNGNACNVAFFSS
jgi:hypothetical protein